MAYLNIYPKRLHLVMKQPQVCKGFVVFDIEQYGVSFQSMTTSIEIMHEPNEVDRWWLKIDPIDSVEVPHFTAFVEVFNYFIFYTLKAKPFFVVEQEFPEWNLHFEDVYFDLSDERPRVVREGTGTPNPIQKLLNKLKS